MLPHTVSESKGPGSSLAGWSRLGVFYEVVVKQLMGPMEAGDLPGAGASAPRSLSWLFAGGSSFCHFCSADPPQLSVGGGCAGRGAHGAILETGSHHNKSTQRCKCPEASEASSQHIPFKPTAQQNSGPDLPLPLRFLLNS